MSTSENLDKYDNLDEIVSKIGNKSNVTGRDKELILYSLNQLSKQDHLYIFTEILQKLEKRIYTVTDNSTLFDLNDLPNDVFWKLYYHTQLLINNMQRSKKINEATNDMDCNNEEMQNQINRELSEHLRKAENQPPVDLSQLSDYEKLRYDALSRCSYSTYYNKNNEELDLSLPDDKRLSQTIYSDTYKHRWTDENSAGQNGNEQSDDHFDNTSSEKTTMTIDEDDDEIDDDDLMVNENLDQVGGEDITQEEEEAELTHFKNRLLKGSKKKKITLKVTPMNYEEEYEDDIY